MDAKFYAYRNIKQKPGSGRMWSVKLRGKVAHRGDVVALDRCTFQVSAKGRAQVLKNRKKVVHAYVASTSIYNVAVAHDAIRNRFDEAVEITYNPYKMDAFHTVDPLRGWGARVESAELVVLCSTGKVYAWGVIEADVAF